jgi:hypothetical protein
MAPAEVKPYSPRMSGRSRHWPAAGERVEAERFTATNLFSFLLWLRFVRGRPLADGAALARWAAEDPVGFRDALWDFAGVIGEPGQALSFTENVLRHKGEQEAVLDFSGRVFSRERLREEVAALAAGLRAAGIGPGDTVGGWVPNGPEGVAAFLGANAIGAVWACEAGAAQLRLKKESLARFAIAHRRVTLGFVQRPLAAPLAILEGGIVERQRAFLGHLADVLLRADVRPDERVVIGKENWLWGLTALVTGASLVFGRGPEAKPPGLIGGATPRE